MQVQIELNADQIEQILCEGLKQAYEVNLTFPDEPDYEKLHQAFQVLLPYFIGEENYLQFVVNAKKNADKVLEHDKKLKKYGKALADAYGGL
jgi:hypothetical protein